jgi:hypothetical protein
MELPIIELTLEELEQGIDATALVENPAIQRNWMAFKDEFAESYTDYPDSVKNNAKAAVKYAEENGWGSCGTDVGKQRASQLAKGEPISLDTIKRMYSFLSRHKDNADKSKGYSDGCGQLMYDAWGGASALSWAESKINQAEKLHKHSVYNFKTHSEDKRILAGALMVADFPMYRNMNGKEFFVKFSSETIEQLADRMVLNNKLTAFNFEHDAKKELADMHIQQFFIINTELGVNTPIGFEELPNGSLFAFVKVNNEQVWNDYVKTGIVKGFSIEGNFATKEEFSEQTFLNEFQTIINMTDKKVATSKLDELVAKAKSLFSEDVKVEEKKEEKEVKMAEATLTDGTKVMYEGELAEGTIVLLEDGTAAPDGEHTFEDGTVISIEGGQVVAVAKPMTEQEMAIQNLTEMVTKLETENAELKSNFEKSINKVEEKFSSQIKESNKLTEDVLELVKTLVAEPTQHSFNTQAKPKSYIDGLVANLKYSQTKIK